MKLNIFYKKQIKSNLYSDKSIFNINLKMILSMNIKKKKFLILYVLCNFNDIIKTRKCSK